MQIGDTTILTPKDNPLQYAPDWRNRVAAAVVDYPDAQWDPIYRPYRDDQVIRDHVKYIRAINTKGARITRDMELHRLASAINQGTRPSDVRFKIESLLLTPIEFEIIQQDMEGGDDEPVPLAFFRLYERLYFSCRRKDGSPVRDCQLRMHFALPDVAQASEDTPIEDIWKTVGATLGYRTLVGMWLWSGAHGLEKQSSKFQVEDMWRISQMVLINRMMRHQVSNFDLINSMKSAAEIFQIEHSLGLTGESNDSRIRTMQAMLTKLAPEIVSAAKTVDENAAVTLDIQAKLRSQRNVNATVIEDQGSVVGEEALNKLINAQFRTAKKE